ncbi:MULTISPECIES: single-stranded DNA-binding protein [unclassified Streptomyces]|uniref:single-stranded DNA-binding protein n=1 Tax=unclassified Streptomyces TaxID=2593676 RepID=UPI0038087470
MSETLVTVVGNVATRPEFKKTPTGVPVARFRLAATARRWDRERGGWSDGHTSFYTVWAWRALGEHVVASVGVGEPLMVQGRLRVREEERDGQRWISADIDAVAAGHDLTRGTSAFRRVALPRPELTVPQSVVTDGGSVPADPAAALSG